MKRLFLPLLLLFLCLFTLHAQAAPVPAGAAYNVAFSPKGEGEKLIVDGINSAQKSILVAAYSFSSKPIAQALLAAHKRGVAVRVVADKKGNTAQYSAVTFLANQGVPVRVNGKYAIMHHKFMVFDGMHLETGSYNYSAAAQTKNAENVLMLRNVPPLAQEYAKEWQRLWNEAEPVAPKY